MTLEEKVSGERSGEKEFEEDVDNSLIRAGRQWQRAAISKSPATSWQTPRLVFRPDVETSP